MTFAARPILNLGAAAPATGVQAFGDCTIDSGDSYGLSTISAGITFNANGTITTSLVADSGYETVPDQWYAPTTTGIGSGYRVRFTRQAGTPWSVGLTNGAFYALDTAPSLSWSAGSLQQVTSVVLVEITASGSGVVLASGLLTINLNNQYE